MTGETKDKFMKISDELYGFFRSWEEWRLKGAPGGCPYSRKLGLCDNFRKVCFSYESEVELKNILIKEYEYHWAPFGNDWSFESPDFGNCHLNPERIAFVQRMIAAYETQKESSQ